MGNVFGGGPSNVTSTTTTALPAWVQPYAQAFLSSYANQVAPGYQQQPGAPKGPPPLPISQFDPATGRSVAPLTPQQQQAMSALTGQAIPTSAALANQFAGNAANVAGGGNVNPATAAATQGQIQATLGGQYANPALTDIGNLRQCPVPSPRRALPTGCWSAWRTRRAARS